MKNLDDVKADMSELYESTKHGGDMKLAAELTNIAGKFLKAVSLEHAREQFLARRAGA